MNTQEPVLGPDARLRTTAFPDAATLQLLLVTSFAYLVLPFVMRGPDEPADWYCRLADAFLHGRLTVEMPGAGGMELIPAEPAGHWFVGYPPLPAIVLMPFRAVLGPSLGLAWIVRCFGVLNAAAFDWALCGICRSLFASAPGPPRRLLFGLLFSIGTMAWHVAIVGGDWHWAHTVATGAMLLAMGEFFGRRRLWLVGLWIAVALGSRPPAAMACLFFAVAAAADLAARREGWKRWLSDFARLAAVPLAMLVLLGAYNAARFGSPFDFGYDRMVLRGEGQELMARHGQFSLHYAPRNLYWFFVAPPKFYAGRPWLLFDLMGLGLLWTTPVVLYCFRAPRNMQPVPAAWIGIAAALLPLATYFSTGYVQFGHRYGMDYLPLLMLLVVLGIGPRPSLLARGLCGFSIAAQAWGAFLWLRYVR